LAIVDVDEPRNVDPKSLPLQSLIDDLTSWTQRFNARLNRGDPLKSDFASCSDQEQFN